MRIRVGPVVAEIRSTFELVHHGIAFHYAAHDLVSQEEFADFHIGVARPGALRRAIKSQALFRFEATTPFKPLAANQAFALLEWGINWSVATHCHQYLIIHSAVVAHGDRALLLPAPPGSGKSTLCAALVARGWRLLSDELSIIDISSGHVVPLPRPISLKNESIDIIASFWPQAAMSSRVDETLKGTVAYARPPTESVRAAARHAKPRWIAIPRYSSNHATELVGVSKAAMLMQLVDNAFNYSIHGRNGFELLADFVASSDCLEFRYGGDLDQAVRMFDELARRP